MDDFLHLQSQILQDMKDDDKHEDFTDKCYKWWDRITLLALIVGFVLGVIFTLMHNDYGQIICAIVIAVSFGLHAGNPFDNGGKLPNM